MRITRSTQFGKDIELAKQQSKDMSIIEEVIRRLFAGDNTIGKDYDIYPCSGFMREYKTLFLRPDWVLVYKLTKDTLCLSRTGSPNIAP